MALALVLWDVHRPCPEQVTIAVLCMKIKKVSSTFFKKLRGVLTTHILATPPDPDAPPSEHVTDLTNEKYFFLLRHLTERKASDPLTMLWGGLRLSSCQLMSIWYQQWTLQPGTNTLLIYSSDTAVELEFFLYYDGYPLWGCVLWCKVYGPLHLWHRPS